MFSNLAMIRSTFLHVDGIALAAGSTAASSSGVRAHVISGAVRFSFDPDRVSGLVLACRTGRASFAASIVLGLV